MPATDAVNRIRPMARATVRYCRQTFGMATATFRLRPSWLIVGTQKGGTTSLQMYLSEHPSVVAPRNKEIHYFNRQYAKPFAWYLGQFPLGRSFRGAGQPMTGEATPEYIVHPDVAARVAERLPDAKLIAVLRDPVSRAFSHYNHERAHGREPLSFEEALDAEAERLSGEEERMRQDGRYYSFAIRNYSYVRRGMYADQLERWLTYFPRKRVLVLQSEALFEKPDSVYQCVLKFLGLPEHHPACFPAHNSRPYGGLDVQTRQRLSQTFAAPNERLFNLIGERFDWCSPDASD